MTDQTRSKQLLGFTPSEIVLAVAASCAIGLLWGAARGDWVLVVTEVPAVAALLTVWALDRRTENGRNITMPAAAVGVLCLVELLVATVVLEATGMRLAALVAGSSALTGAGLVIWWYVVGRATEMPA